jgi:glutamine synthetase
MASQGSPLSPFPSLHEIQDYDDATLGDLSLLIRSFPVIDNHAHNLYSEKNALGCSDYPFLAATSETDGTALNDHVYKSLSHFRATRSLAQLYSCSEDLSDLKATRRAWISRDYEGMIAKCLEGTHTIMMDDGLNTQLVSPFKWHQKFVNQVSKIVRIETVAADIIQSLVCMTGMNQVTAGSCRGRDQVEALLLRFHTHFRNQIQAFANDPEIRAFKSIICYRTGLDISLASKKALRPQQSLTESNLLTVFHEYIMSAIQKSDFKIEMKEINDFLVVIVCDVLARREKCDEDTLPFQFHTGSADSDLNLVKANPACMQTLLRAYPTVDFVLLHSAYPYAREAGYLASVFPNVWLDIGQIFPTLSRDGQDSTLQMALELAPSSKILWSTGGHLFPETYWLANQQFRQSLERFLRAGVVAGDYSIRQAIDIAVDIMFWNSNSVYKLGEECKNSQLLSASGKRTAEPSIRTLVNRRSHTGSSNSPRIQLTAEAGLSRGDDDLGRSSAATTNSIQGRMPASSHRCAKTNEFDAFLTKNPLLKYVRLQFIDYSGISRHRMIPVAEFRKQLGSSNHVEVPMASLLQLLQDVAVAPQGSSSDPFLIQPDLATLTPNDARASPSATVQTWWLENGSLEPLQGCPRATLQKLVDAFKSRYSMSIMMGFDIEVMFMRPKVDSNTTYLPVHAMQSCSYISFNQDDILPVVEEIVEAMARVNISISQFHSETAPGQWRFTLPTSDPLRSVDILYKARDVICNLARKQGLKATIHPRPLADSSGNGCHVRFSIEEGERNDEKRFDSFLAGMIGHLPAITALTLPLEESYSRVKDGIRAGGEWIAWGKQNPATPLVQRRDGHWELRAVDGTANMYLGMAAMLAAGLAGVEDRVPLRLQDCTGDPSKMSAEQRQNLGIQKNLPAGLEESLMCLERDEMLGHALGNALVENYVAVKRAEMKKMASMGEEERRRWLIGNY